MYRECIALGRGMCKTVSLTQLQKVTLYQITYINSDSPTPFSNDWGTPKELFDYIQQLFGPGTRFD